MRKLIPIIFLSIIFSFFSPRHAFAAKPRVRNTGTGTKATTGISYSSAKLSRATNSVVLTFKNLGSVSKASYELNYTANGIAEGAMGSVVPSGASTESRDLYFGTCSHAVCTPHNNIRNAFIIVTTTLSNGQTNVKRYSIKL